MTCKYKKIKGVILNITWLFNGDQKKKDLTQHHINLSNKNKPLIVAHCSGVWPSWFLERRAWQFHRYRRSAVWRCPLEHAQLSGVQPRESCRNASTSHSSTSDGFSSRHRRRDTINLSEIKIYKKYQLETKITWKPMALNRHHWSNFPPWIVAIPFCQTSKEIG